MGLLGLFFNKSLLKLILIVAALFLVLRITGWLASLVAGLSPVALTALLTATLSISTLLTTRIDRLKFLSVTMKLLSLTLIPVVLIFQASTSIPAPLNLLLEFAPLPIFLIAYSAYRKKMWIWKEFSSPQNVKRRYRRLSKEGLVPKGIESGHVVFSVGRSGFRVLRFIEIAWQQTNPRKMRDSIERAHAELAGKLSMHIFSTRKSNIETSLECYYHNEAPHIIVTLACEGRKYRECRARIDESANILSQKLRPSRPDTPQAKILIENAHAQRALMMPLLTTLERLRRIENDNQNARLIFTNDSEIPMRLRLIRLTNLHSNNDHIESGLFEELVRIGLANNRSLNLAFMLHINPIKDSTLNEELGKTDKSYQSAMAQVAEEASFGLFYSKGQSGRLLPKKSRKIADASRGIEEAKNQFRRLKQAEESGYYEVSLTLLGEPATAENMARKVKSKMSLYGSNAIPSVDLLPPAVFQAAVRRDLRSSFDKLNGEELASFLGSQSTLR